MPAELILDYARKEKVDLIVTRTRGRSGIVRWALGSAADKVIRHTTVPFLLVMRKAIRKT